MPPFNGTVLTQTLPLRQTYIKESEICSFTTQLQFSVTLTFSKGYTLLRICAYAGKWTCTSRPVHGTKFPKRCSFFISQPWSAPADLQQSRWELFQTTVLSHTVLHITLWAILFVGLVWGIWHQNINSNQPQASSGYCLQDRHVHGGVHCKDIWAKAISP